MINYFKRCCFGTIVYRPESLTTVNRTGHSPLSGRFKHRTEERVNVNVIQLIT